MKSQIHNIMQTLKYKIYDETVASGNTRGGGGNKHVPGNADCCDGCLLISNFKCCDTLHLVAYLKFFYQPSFIF